ncbi:sodium/hydrogen exchanger [Halolamina litorea]|uniref:Sodium:calcium antiporter n=1 Tax=Halolamina litorea TaxID=1515593 RepID=A0ABD6BTZ2_9EURY|nr:sodium:proton exchanger [Halolamina litorea]
MAVLAGVDGAGGAVGVASAQEDEAGEEGEEEEGGIEGAIEGFIESQGTIGTLLVLLFGIGLLIASTEKLISYLARASLQLRLSLFALAIIFTGFEFDDTVLALVFSAGGMEGAALGTALGTGLAITGVTLAVAAIIQPFPVDLPRDYIALFVLGPLLIIPLAVTGTLTFGYGLVLVLFFFGTFGYLIYRESQRDIPVFRDTEIGKALRGDGGTKNVAELDSIPEERYLGRFADSGGAWLGLAVLALVGIVFAAMLLEGGSEAVTESFGIEGTLFGATILTLILTFEDIMLTIEPVRRGLPEIGVGNVIGSVLFSVTGNIGIVAFFGDVTVSSTVLTFHLPAMIIVTALAGYFLSTGKMERWHGYALGGLYVAYWVIAIVVFSGVPVGE